MRTWLSIGLCLAIVFTIACSDNSTNSDSELEKYTLDATQCDPVIIAVHANQTLKITATDSVHTHVNGLVEDCDYWTDADGICDCHYVEEVPALHGLPFMALIGNWGDEWFLVGTEYENAFATDGQLSLYVNDWGGCGEDSDNSGKFEITVQRR